MRKYVKTTALALAAALTVTTVIPVPAVEAATVKNLNKATVTEKITVGVGCKQKIAVTNIPTKAKVTYVSKNKKIASVTKKGYVKGKKVGSAVVKAKLTYKKKTVTKKCKVTVKKAVTGIKLKKSTISLNVGSTYKLNNKVTVTPTKALQTVSYTSNKKTVASVTTNGKITAKKAGTAKITVKAQDGSAKKAVLTVKVNSGAASPTEVPTTEPTEVPTTEPTVTPTTEPTEVPTTEPTEIPTTKPTEVPTTEPTTEPTEIPTTEPTVTPTLVPDIVTKTITASDVVDGKVMVSGTYDNVVIESSVGSAEIILNDSVIKNTLTLKGGADYVVNIQKADIANVSVETDTVTTQSLRILEIAKVPTINISEDTVIENIKIAADVNITGSANGTIASVTIARKVNASISAPAQKLAIVQEATAATVTIASEIAEIQVAANVELNVEKDGKVTTIEIAATAAETILEVIGTVQNVIINAQGITVTGTGTVTTITIESDANNTTIQGIISEKISVAEQVIGTTINGNPVVGGTTTSTVSSGGSSNGGSSSGGSSSGGSSSGGSSSGSNPTTEPTTVPTTEPTTEPPVTQHITETFTTTDSMPNFKATYNDGKVVIYSISKDEVEAYYKDPDKTTLSYTKIEYNGVSGVTAETTVEAPVTLNGITSATITIEDFTCVANVNVAAKNCEVTVSTTSTDVEEITFVGSVARAKYYKSEDGYNGASLEIGSERYIVKFDDLMELKTAISNSVDITYYQLQNAESTGSEQLTNLTASVTKTSDNRAYFTIHDDVKVEIYIDEKNVYVTASSATVYDKFDLGWATVE